jgi:hypothetical protein
LINASKQDQLTFPQESIKHLNVSSFQQYSQNINLFIKFIIQYIHNHPKELFTDFLRFIFVVIPSENAYLINSLDFSIISDCFSLSFKFPDLQDIF